MPSDDDFLPTQQAELKRLGFKTLKIEPGVLIMASGRSFYWDCLLTFMNYTIFVRKVERLSAEVMDSDRTRFQALAKELNPASLPRGLQSGNAVLTVYIANEINTDAQQLCKKTRSISGFAKFYLAGALDTTQNNKYFATKSPLVGMVYYGKFRYLINRLLDPKTAPEKEPLSGSGVFLLAVMALLFLIPVLAIMLAVAIG